MKQMAQPTTSVIPTRMARALLVILCCLLHTPCPAQPSGAGSTVVAEDVTATAPMLSDPNLTDRLIAVNFDQADIRYVLKTISDITGINFIVDDSITGTVTVLSPTRIRLGDLFGFLESILQVKGYAAVRAAEHVKIVPQAQAARHNLPTQIGRDPAAISQDDSIITQIIPLKYADATELTSIVTARLPVGASLAAYPRTNTIVVTGASSQIHHMATIIAELDVPDSSEQLTVIPMTYASAETLSRQIAKMMQAQTSPMTGRSFTNPATRQTSTLQIHADERTNSLIVVADQHDTRLIADLVAQLDIERPPGTANVHVVYLKNAQAKPAAESLALALANLQAAAEHDAGPRIGITPDEGTNALIINASPQDFNVIGHIIDKLDIAREQVLVELIIMEIGQDTLRQIGVDWATLDHAVSDNVRAFGSTNFGIRVDSINGDLGGLSVGAFKQIDGTVQIGSILNALENVSGVNILSTPHILTSNHQRAEIIVGDNIPFVTNTRITETDPSTPTVIKTIEYRDVGVTLQITPHISQGGLIRLQIESQFTQLVEGVTNLSTDTPTTAKRQLQTEISMADGTTVVIGGLIRDDKITTENKIPILGDLPLLGGLFKLQRDRIQKTNLLLFITPHVLSTAPEMEDITRQKQAEITPQLEQRLKQTGADPPDFHSIWR